MPETVSVLVGLGANVGNPVEQLARAVCELGALGEVRAVSSVYRTEPVGYADQPDFYNLVCELRTALAADALLDATQAIEREMGRVRTFRNGPRPIDVDLLAYGDVVAETPRLSLPHPGIALRGFVLHPLAEVAPEWRHPVLGRTARELLFAAEHLERAERWGPLPRA